MQEGQVCHSRMGCYASASGFAAGSRGRGYVLSTGTLPRFQGSAFLSKAAKGCLRMEAFECPDGLKAVGVFEDGIYHILCQVNPIEELDIDQTLSTLLFGTGLIVSISALLLLAAHMSSQSARRRWRSRSRGASDEELGE